MQTGRSGLRAALNNARTGDSDDQRRSRLRQVIRGRMGIRQIAENQRLCQRRAVEFRLPLHKATGATCLFRFVHQHLLHGLGDLRYDGYGNPRSLVHLLQCGCMHDARERIPTLQSCLA
jgi:hypothetical protein